jgi:phospholipase D1/2
MSLTDLLQVLIADDRTVICGSANLNDRSQLGNHDSEIAVVITGPLDTQTTFAGHPYQVNRFASSLRRQLFRKHLGLLPPQDYTTPDANYLPVTAAPENKYDWGSEEDRVVADPLAPEFMDRWNETARTNTEVFGKVFHVVPHDSVQTWDEYDNWYEKNFREPAKDDKKPAGPYKVGHVVREEFPGGVAEVKEQLSRVRGTLVEMPLRFLKKEDIAKEGLGLNAFTEEVYT